MTKRLALAFGAYIALGALAFTTLSDPKIRAVTLLILAMFAVKTWVRRGDVMHRDHDNGSSEEFKPM